MNNYLKILLVLLSGLILLGLVLLIISIPFEISWIRDNVKNLGCFPNYVGKTINVLILVVVGIYIIAIVNIDIKKEKNISLISRIKNMLSKKIPELKYSKDLLIIGNFLFSLHILTWTVFRC